MSATPASEHRRPDETAVRAAQKRQRTVPKYQLAQVEPLTPGERRLLESYVSSLDENVFVVTGPTGVVGAAYARYSRYYGGVRTALAREFFTDGSVNAKRADDMIRRVLVEFGDDSVGEMENAHLSCEQVSNLATKEMEDRRIGGSPIEQSSRYVAYDLRNSDGTYRYVRPKEILASPYAQEFLAVMDRVFDVYTEVVADFIAYFETRKSLETAEYQLRENSPKIRWDQCADADERKAFKVTYRADIRTAACDRARVLLPAATATNVGFNANGRFYQHLLTHLYSHDLHELQELAARMHAALNTVIPRYVARAKRDAYRVKTRDGIHTAVRGLQPPSAGFVAEVELHDNGEAQSAARGVSGDALLAVLKREQVVRELAYGLYPYTESRFLAVCNVLRGRSEDELAHLYATYIGERSARRDRPGRGLEWGYPFVFELETDFGIYRDLERHRMLTQQRQLLTPSLGFIDLSGEYREAGVADKIAVLLPQVEALYERLRRDLGPLVAQYAVLFGYRLRWMIGCNGRALMHLVELRTGKQGHPSYRRVCQRMHRLLEMRHPLLAKAMTFVDHADYPWARADSEARQRLKERQLGIQSAESTDV